MKLTKNFTLKELTKSQTAIRKGIDNSPEAHHIENLKTLCEKVLQPLRDSLKKPIIISSGYRCEKLNKAIGGSRASQHMTGQAADIDMGDDYLNLLVFDLIESSMSFDQLIWEYGDNTAPSWVHVSYVSEEKNRKQVLRVR